MKNLNLSSNAPHMPGLPALLYSNIISDAAFWFMLFFQYHFLRLQLQYVAPHRSAKHLVLLSFTGFYLQVRSKL